MRMPISCALRDRVRHHAVNTQPGQQQRHACEAAEQQHNEARRGNRIGDESLHSLHIRNSQIAIQRLRFFAHRRDVVQGVAARAQRHRHEI